MTSRRRTSGTRSSSSPGRIMRVPGMVPQPPDDGNPLVSRYGIVKGRHHRVAAQRRRIRAQVVEGNRRLISRAAFGIAPVLRAGSRRSETRNLLPPIGGLRLRERGMRHRYAGDGHDKSRDSHQLAVAPAVARSLPKLRNAAHWLAHDYLVDWTGKKRTRRRPVTMHRLDTVCGDCKTLLRIQH